LSWSFQNARGDDFSTEPNYGCPYLVMDMPLYSAAVVSSSFFLAYSQQLQTGCLLYFHTWCGLSANSECRSEMCSTRFANIQDAKIRHLLAIAQLYLAVLSQLRHLSTIRKKLGKQQYLFHKASQYGERRPTAEISWWWGTPANFNGFRVLVSLLHQRRSTEVNQTLQDVWLSLGLVQYIYILGALVP